MLRREHTLRNRTRFLCRRGEANSAAQLVPKGARLVAEFIRALPDSELDPYRSGSLPAKKDPSLLEPHGHGCRLDPGARTIGPVGLTSTNCY